VPCGKSETYGESGEQDTTENQALTEIQHGPGSGPESWLPS
jgi:hypothetical protein